MEFTFDHRAESARMLGPGRRLAMLASFARGRDIPRNVLGGTYPALLGLHRYQRWLTESGRLADGSGSAWWSQVNGLILLDMAEAAALASDGDVGPSAPVRAWTAYWANPTKGAATRLCWEAHQCSLEAGVRAAEGALVREPTAERAFIAVALSSVEIAARADLPLGRSGSRIVGGFCRAFYPGSYPAEDGAGADGRKLLARATSGRHPGLRIATGVIRGRVIR